MESVTGLSEAAWLVGEDCDEVALSPLPPQATSSSAGTSASITYDAARGVEIRFVMEDSCMGCARGAVSRTDCLQSVRSEEGRVGKECVRTGNTRWKPKH